MPKPSSDSKPAQPPSAQPSAQAATRQDVNFRSEGAELAGWFYTPDAPPPWPLVIMTHGFSATRAMTADKYAETFQRAGIAVLLYDHHGFGQSGGTPRRQINHWRQARGYLDALAIATKLPTVDKNRIALWGDSLSGGMVLAVASMERVAAIVLQVPAIGGSTPPSDPNGALCRALQTTIRSGNIDAGPGDVIGPMPVVSDNQWRRVSALRPVTAYRWFTEYGGREGTGWMNEVTLAYPQTPVAWHAALCAKQVTAPALFVVSPIDEMGGANPRVARYAFDQVQGPKQWFEVEGGHFGLLYYPSENFDQASAVQAKFLAATLKR